MFCLCTLLFCRFVVVVVVVLCYLVILLFCDIFNFVCTGVRLLPPGEGPIAVNNNNNNNLKPV